MAVNISKVGRVLWPEATGIAAATGVQMIAAKVDEYRRKDDPEAAPVVQTASSLVVLGGSALAIATDTAPEFFSGALYFGVVGAIVNGSRWLIERARAEPQRVVGGWDTFVLVPRKRGVIARGHNVAEQRALELLAQPVQAGLKVDPQLLETKPLSEQFIVPVPEYERDRILF